MVKKPKDKTLGQIEEDIQKGEFAREEVIDTANKFAGKRYEPKVLSFANIMILVVCLLLMGFGELERARMLVVIGGIGFLMLVIKIVVEQALYVRGEE